MFCSKNQAELLTRMAAIACEYGRPIARGADRRYFAKNCEIWIDYQYQPEVMVRHVRRDFDRYASVPGYADHPSKRDRVVSHGHVQRLRGEGWCAVIGPRVNVSGDISKMERDISLLRMFGHTEWETHRA